MDLHETGLFERDESRKRFTFNARNKHRWRLELDMPGLRLDLGSSASFQQHFYPMFVMNVRNLRSLQRLPFHEQALKRGLLERVTETSVIRSSVIFVSHCWEDRGFEHPDDDLLPSPGHPDDGENCKLAWLKDAAKHLDFPERDFYIWMDYFSVPQFPDNFFFKMLAIRSIPAYMSTAAACVPLVKFPVAPGKANHEVKARAINQFRSRGWCRLELIAMLCPKKYPQGGWMTGSPVHYAFYSVSGDARDNCAGPQVTAADMLLPSAGQFYKPGDEDMVEDILESLAEMFSFYDAEMGLTSRWDLCMKTTERPDWLQEMGEEEALLARKHARRAKQLVLPGANEAAASVARWGERQLRSGDFQGGTCACSIAVLLAPERPEPHLWLGLLFISRSNQESHARLLEKYPLPRHRAGTYSNFYLDQALECFKSALKAQPRYPIARFGMAEVLMKKRLKSEAVKEYQAAMVEDPKIATAFEDMMQFFEGRSHLDLEARDRDRDREARRLRYELSRGWKIKRVT